MKVVSIRVDDQVKALMETYNDVNWSEVIRRSIRERLDLEESLRRGIDRRRATKAAHGMDALRRKTSGRWSGAKEVRKWRDLRR